jgi:predicted membrane protein
MSKTEIVENNKDNVPVEMNGWALLYNIIRIGLEKDKLLVVFFFLVPIIILMKWSQPEIIEMLKFTLNILSGTYGNILGWTIAVLILFISIISMKAQRKIHKREMNRVTTEKSKLQNTYLDNKTRSSK